MRPLLLGVPTYRRYDLLPGLIASAIASSVCPSRVLVVDNGGQFDAKYAGPHKTKLEVIRPGRNIGVAAAWNLILDAATTEDDVCIANDDVEVTEDGFDFMQSALAHHKGRAIVLGEGYSLFLMRRSLLAEAGYFDEGFWPAYAEDDDYQYRLKLLDVPSVLVPASRFHHKSATIHSYSPQERVEFDEHWRANVLRYRDKWGGMMGQETLTMPALETLRKSA